MDRPMRLVLASGSPRRRELLSGLGWRFHVVVPQVDESPLAGEGPMAMALRLSVLKASQVVFQEVRSLVIAADTVVDLDGTALGKPRDREEAFHMIMSLQGRDHLVHTGVSVAFEDKCLSHVETTRVRFRPLSSHEAKCYVDSGEGDDKAGGYAIQGKGAVLIEAVEGCYFNVVGLPLSKLSRLLENLGLQINAELGLGSQLLGIVGCGE